MREEFGASSVARPEQAQDGRGRHDRAGLADAAHDRAQVGRLEDDADTLWYQALLEELGDLLGQALLDLQATRVHLDDPWDLGQPDDPTARDIGDGCAAEERQQVVLAQRVERDVLDHHHLAVGDVVDRAIDQALGIHVVARGQLGVHPMHPFRGAGESLAIGVLADLGQDFADGGLDPVVSGRRLVGALVAARTRDVVGLERGLADLGLDLVHQPADIWRQVGVARHARTPGVSGDRTSGAVQLAYTTDPAAVNPAAGSGSKPRPSAPRSQALAFSPSDGRW